MTARKTSAKQSEQEPKGERELTAGTAEPDPKTGDQAAVSPPAAEAERRTVSPSLQTVEEFQSVGDDPEFLAGQTVEPDFDQAEDERAQGADRAYLDGRTRNRP